MNHRDTHSMQTNRPAARRRHRRLALSFIPTRIDGARVVRSAPTTIASLPKSLLQEAGMFELLAAEARVAELENALAEARAVAFVDPLTGALNRRGFDQACQRELARTRRNGVPLSVAHIDLDDFKRLNDSFGHQAGDRALVHLVDLLHKSMRPTDVLCRFGGEEFVILLPDTAVEDAAAAVARFQSDFSARAIPGTECFMTFSAGVVVHAGDESIDTTIQRADAATYTAKRSGKNCVVVS